jgi:hypothetical protein
MIRIARIGLKYPFKRRGRTSLDFDSDAVVIGVPCDDPVDSAEGAAYTFTYPLALESAH